MRHKHLFKCKLACYFFSWLKSVSVNAVDWVENGVIWGAPESHALLCQQHLRHFFTAAWKRVGRAGGWGWILAWNLTLQQNKRKQRRWTQAKPIWKEKVAEPSVKMSDNSWLWSRDDNNTPKSFMSASSATHVETFSTWTITHIVPVPLLTQHPPSTRRPRTSNSLDLQRSRRRPKQIITPWLFV